MASEFTLYNTLSRTKQPFRAINPPFVGVYVCGPTVYGDPHLGHARSAITFDLLFRYLRHLDYKVRYVRNITDVGHLENDADQGDDKISKQARLEQLEPMEVSQHYTRTYHSAMDRLGVLRPSIEPTASGHVIEQIEMIKKILDAGYAYQSNGSVYFDVQKYAGKYNYGELSGRVLEDMMANTRQLEGQTDKRNSFDFALWKKAAPEHIMRWPSPWSDGFPGWHLECSAMSAKYLGENFDIHGGGMDLMFPHHECEIAQNTVVSGHHAARYWMHNNMITVDGQKMGKSLGNSISLGQLFSGEHPILEQPFSPMTVRFFILQAHYRSTLDFSNEALRASEKGLERLMAAMATLDKITPSERSTVDPAELMAACVEAMNDDLNSPVAIAVLFDWVRTINQLHDGTQTITADDLLSLRGIVKTIIRDILGLQDEKSASGEGIVAPLVEMILDVRSRAKANKDWATSDHIRDELTRIGISVRDRKDGTDWSID